MKICPHCKKEIPWQNNIISRRMSEEFPHDFSICDIDSVARCFYKINKYITRVIYYESKNKNETISKTQFDTLKEIKKSVNWKLYDKYSGCFIFSGKDINFDNIDVYKFNTNFKDYKLFYIKTITIKQLYEWFSCKDIFKSAI